MTIDVMSQKSWPMASETLLHSIMFAGISVSSSSFHKLIDVTKYERHNNNRKRKRINDKMKKFIYIHIHTHVHTVAQNKNKFTEKRYFSFRYLLFTISFLNNFLFFLALSVFFRIARNDDSCGTVNRRNRKTVIIKLKPVIKLADLVLIFIVITLRK